MTFTCGHEAEVPRNMGRGMARQRRLRNHFSRNCRLCAEAHIRQQVATLTHIDASPLTAGEQGTIAAKRIAQLRY